MAMPPSRDEILHGLKKDLHASLPEKDSAQIDLAAVEMSTSILSLPLDSLSLLALTGATEDRFGVFIPDDLAFSFEQVGDLVDYVYKRLQERAS